MRGDRRITIEPDDGGGAGGDCAATLHNDENTILVVEGRRAHVTARRLRFRTAIGGCFAVWVRQGARLELVDCDVTSGQSSGIVAETQSELELRRCLRRL